MNLGDKRGGRAGRTKPMDPVRKPGQKLGVRPAVFTQRRTPNALHIELLTRKMFTGVMMQEIDHSGDAMLAFATLDRLAELVQLFDKPLVVIVDHGVSGFETVLPVDHRE